MHSDELRPARAERERRGAGHRNASVAAGRCSSAVLLSVVCGVLLSAVVDVMQLPVADLQKLRQSLTEDVQTITQNYGNLKVRRTAAAAEHEGSTEQQQQHSERAHPTSAEDARVRSIASI